MTKKHFVRVIIFTSIFFYLFFSISYVLRPEGDTKDRFAGFYALEENCLDMVIIGSSPVHPYWAASLAYGERGFTSYPLATNVQQPRLTKFLIEEALKTQSPKVIVVETRMFMRPQTAFDFSEDNEAHIRNVTDNVKYSRERVELINELVKERRETYWFDIMSSHKYWPQVVRTGLVYWGNEKKSVYNGYLFVPEVEEVIQHVISDECMEEVKMPKEQEDVLQEIIAWAKENNQKMIFVLNPYGISEEECKMANYMERIIRGADFEFINFNKLSEEMNINFATDFYNSGHMNVLGAEKYTSYFAKFLQENYSLPDHRGDSQYTEWDEDYQVWLEQAEVTKQEIYKLISGEQEW